MAAKSGGQQRQPKDSKLPQRSGWAQWFQENSRYITSFFVVGGIGLFVLGVLVWIFFREIENIGLVVLAIGVGLLLTSALISWRSVLRAVLGHRGQYGLSTAIILLVVIAIAGVANYLLFWGGTITNPPGWIRVDTTSNKQTLLADQAVNALQNLKEPVEVTAFFTIDNPEDARAWQVTEDLLSEFKRRSTVERFTYTRVDYELNPNAAINYGVSRFPALVVEAANSKRREIIYPAVNTGESPSQPFNENDIVTGLLVVNQITQKIVMLITGHQERLISDVDPNGIGWGFGAQNLERENYIVIEGTIDELTRLLTNSTRGDDPAVVITAGLQQDLDEPEVIALSNYLRIGGALLVAAEPGTANFAPRFASVLNQYGFAIGQGVAIDRASFVGLQPSFLQLKASNGQLPMHQITTNFDVLFLPGSTHFGIVPEATPERVPLDDNGVPYIRFTPLAWTTLDSWSEVGEEISYTSTEDAAGPLPVIMAMTAISPINGQPQVIDGEIVTTRIVAIGDADFASNGLIASARNSDLLINSVNWLAQDFELISLRPKLREPRLLFLTQSELEFIQWSGWLLMPVLVGAFGVWIWWRRRA